MASVSISEAWADASHLNESNHAYVAPPRASVTPPPKSPDRQKHRKAKKALAEYDEPDFATCASVMSSLTSELKLMREMYAQQQRDQKNVLYVAVAVILLLLVFVAHSYSRLQYATDCLTHWRK